LLGGLGAAVYETIMQKFIKPAALLLLGVAGCAAPACRPVAVAPIAVPPPAPAPALAQPPATGDEPGYLHASGGAFY